jgi:aryl-alcohol dehydrogenase-like predicted oxidoreductase
MFRQNWKYDPSGQDKTSTLENMYECLIILQNQVDKGNIRHFGLSNESAWGTANWLKLSEQHNLPRVATIQNEYSLLCRLYDTDLAELSVNEGVGLMAFSPLAAGLLTGKYLDGNLPKNCRKSINQDLGGRDNVRLEMAVRSYLKIAKEFGLDPIHLALTWCRTRPFMCSSIFGATTVDQLPVILESVDIELTQECIDLINEAHKLNPMPF